MIMGQIFTSTSSVAIQTNYYYPPVTPTPWLCSETWYWYMVHSPQRINHNDFYFMKCAFSLTGVSDLFKVVLIKQLIKNICCSFTATHSALINLVSRSSSRQPTVHYLWRSAKDNVVGYNFLLWKQQFNKVNLQACSKAFNHITWSSLHGVCSIVLDCR